MRGRAPRRAYDFVHEPQDAAIRSRPVAQPGHRADSAFRHRRESRRRSSPRLRSHRRADVVGRYARPVHERSARVAVSTSPPPDLSTRSDMTHPSVSYPRNPETPASHLPFSPSACFGDLIFISGQASVDAAGKIVGDTFEGEFRRSIENVAKVLEAAGSDLKHVIQTRNYVRDADDLLLYNRLYREYFFEPFPARTTI